MPKKQAKEQKDWKNVGECLYVYTPSGTYYGLVRKGGKQIKRSLKTQDRKLAERRLREFREQVGNLSSNASDRRMKFGALSDRWLVQANTGLKESTAKRNALCVRTLKSTFALTPLTQLSRLDCEAWLARRAKDVSARTANYDLQILKRILNYGVDSGIIFSSPASSLSPLKRKAKEIIIPSREEFGILIETLASMRHPCPRTQSAIELVKLLAYSGMRLNEATNITWGEVDFENERFTVSGGEYGTKNNEIRKIPLFPNLRKFLEELRENRSEFLETAIPKSGKIANTKTARTAIESACKIANLPKFDHHCLRHYFASNAIEHGVDFKTIAHWLGHKDGGILVAKTYGHLRDTHSNEMAKLMT